MVGIGHLNQFDTFMGSETYSTVNVSGKELISKSPLPNISKVRLASVSYVDDVTFLLLSETVRTNLNVL